MNRRQGLTLLAGLCAVALTAAPAGAQGVQRGNFDVNIGGGAMLHPNASALKSVSPLINLKARMFATDNIGLGFSLDYARTETDDDIFPLAQFRFSTAGSTMFISLKQPVALFHYQFQATFGAPVAGGSLYPYLSGGVGGYTIYLDPQQSNGPNRQSDLLLSVGGAVKFNLASNSSIELGVRDVIYTSFDRNRLNPTPNRTCRASGDVQFSGNVCPNERFPFLDPERSDPNWSPPEDTIHNIVLTASFSFFPEI